jgi:small-conductance mechanosensitive channel
VSIRRIAVIIMAIVAMGSLTYAAARLEALPPRMEQVVYAALIVTGGVYLVRTMANTLRRAFQPLVGAQAAGAAILLQVVGYIVIAILVMTLVGIPPEAAIAGGTVTGLVLGFGAQATIANILAGLIILASRPFKLGDRVAILTASIPYQMAFLPPYKFFSRDYILPAYTGVVTEMGLMYTVMITDDGLTIRFPNSLIISNAAVANYSDSTERTRKIRYEFPVEIPPSRVLSRLSERLSMLGVNVTEPVIEEQSDKNSYIISVLATHETRSEWPQIKSKILEQFIEIHRELTAKP